MSNNYYGTSSNDPLYAYGLYPQTKHVSPKSLFTDVNVVKPIKTVVQTEGQSNMPVEIDASTGLPISANANGSASTTQNIVSKATGTGFSSDNTAAGSGEASPAGSSAAVEAAVNGTSASTAPFDAANLAYNPDYNANSASANAAPYNSSFPASNTGSTDAFAWQSQNGNYGAGGINGLGTTDGMDPMAGIGSAGLGTPSSLDNLQNAQARNIDALSSDRNLQMWGGGIGGGLQLGLGVLKYMDDSKNNAMNRKVMQQQIDTNNQLMADRRQRNADIARDFGPNGVMSKATGV
jgi:hypothetical protein